MERYYASIIDFVDGTEIENNRYYAYDSGEIYDEINQEYLNIKPRDCDGYCSVSLYTTSGKKAKFYTHRVIAATLIDRRLKYNNNLVVNHLTPDAKYDNSVSNLEVCTQKENIHYAIKLGRFKAVGEENPSANLTDSIVHSICSIMEEFPNKTYKTIAEELELTYLKGIEDTIGKIRQGKEWKHISSHYNLQRRVRSCMNQFEMYKSDIEKTIIKNPELKARDIANILSINIDDKKTYQAFHKLIGRMKSKLL